MIKKFTIESFRSVESAQMELGNINVFIGANGSGKSNLLEGFGVLAAAASGRVDTESLVRRGCRPGGLYRPLFPTSSVDADTVVSAEGERASYCAGLSSPPRDRPTGWEFRREVLKQDGEVIVERPMTSGAGKGEPQSGLAALRLAEMAVGSEAAVFLKSLAAYSLYAPDTQILRGSTQDPQVRAPIGLSGGRLAHAVFELVNDRRMGSQLDAELREAVEWFDHLSITDSGGPYGPWTTFGLLFADRFLRTENGHPHFLNPDEVNEGMLYALFLKVLCFHADAPRLFALDNADHGLNPLLAKRLVQSMCTWLIEGKPPRQVLMTTHNPLVLDGLALEDDRIRLFIVDRDNRGTTQVRRFVITDQNRDMAAKGWTLSRMWINGLIGGIPNV
jgi:energy-coupling factor transporter ATP-binding protein EcfA2